MAGPVVMEVRKESSAAKAGGTSLCPMAGAERDWQWWTGASSDFWYAKDGV